MEDLKNETIIPEEDIVEQEEMTSVPSTPPSINEAEQCMKKAYSIIVVSAVFAFLIPLIAFISPKTKIREKTEHTLELRHRAWYEGEKLSQRLSDTTNVISSVQQARTSIDWQEKYLKEIIDRKKERRTFTVNGCEFTMIRVDGGTFNMGSKNGDNDESPVHRVTLSSYYIGETEVTQKLWRAIMGNNPSEDSRGQSFPVTNVDYDDCISFVKKLNERTELPFSLPTEAQWEFAARGGNKSKGYKYSGSNTCSDVANHVEYSFWSELLGYSNNIMATRSKAANELGLYDMSGNVREWCWDYRFMYEQGHQIDPICFDVVDPNAPLYSIVRGGGFLDKPYGCRNTDRQSVRQVESLKDVGFRLVLNDASEKNTKTTIKRTETTNEVKTQSSSLTNTSTQTPIKVIKEVNVKDLKDYIQQTKK